MVCPQLLALLLIVINIKCVVSLRTHTFRNRLGIQHQHSDFLHGGEQGRRRDVPTFVNVTYKNGLKLPSRCIFDRLRNPFKCLSPLRGSFQTVQVSRRERKGDSSRLENLSITQGTSVAVLQGEGKNVVSEKRNILCNRLKERTQDGHLLDEGSDAVGGGSKDQITHDRGIEIEQGKSPKREEGGARGMSQIQGKGGSLVGRSRGAYRKRGPPQGVVDIQNTHVRGFLQGGGEGRSLHLLNYIYQSWKEKNFANFVTAIKDEGFDHTCVEKWLHKMSISLNKKYVKIQLRRDYVLIKNKYFDPRQTRVKEFHLTYGDINRCLEILIKDMGKFCSYEMSSILWAITIILIKLFKSSNSVDTSACAVYSEREAVVTTLLRNFREFFSLIVSHLNRVKGYLSIDESLWAIWSLCKLLHFNVLAAPPVGGGSGSGGSGGGDFSASDPSLGTSPQGEGPREGRAYSPHQVAYLKNKFQLTEESVTHILDIFNHIYKYLHGNLQFLQEKYYVYIPFIIFESQTLLLRSSVLLLNKILSIILRRNILLSLFSFDTLKRQYGRGTPQGQSRGAPLVSIPHSKNGYAQNGDVFKIKTLSKVYKLIKCISKIFYPLKNPNIRNLNLHNNYRSLDVALLGDFVRACNDVLVKYVDYFVFVIGRGGGECPVEEGGEVHLGVAAEGEDRLPPGERIRVEHKNELVFIYNCLKSSLVSLIKLDLKDKYLYEWLNGNMHLFQFGRARRGNAPVGNAPVGSGPVGSGPVGSGPVGSGPISGGPVGSGPISGGPMGNVPIAAALGDRYSDHFQSEELPGEGPPLVEGSPVGETNSKNTSYGEPQVGDGNTHLGQGEGVNLTPLGPPASVTTATPSNGSANPNDVCLDVLALSKFTKLYSTEMKRKLIDNVKRSIADSLNQFEDLYGGSDTDQVHYPTYVCINDIYIIQERKIEELYDEETKTFFKKKKKNNNFRNIIMPKQLAIYVNYIGRNMNLVETKKQLDEIFSLSVRYINTTRFNYFTSNDIIHFLQGLLNYYQVERKGVSALSEQVSKMLILLCSIVESSFLKWKSSNVCQLVYLLTKYKHIHRNIFNKFDWLLSTIEFPRYVYKRARVDPPGGGAAQSDYPDSPKMDSTEVDSPKMDIPEEDSPKMDIPKMDGPKMDSPEVVFSPPPHRSERTSKPTHISINEIKYDNLGSALWAMTSLNKHVIRKKFFLKFCYLFSVYISLHMKLYLSEKHRGGYYANGLDISTERTAKGESPNDDHFLRHHASYFKMPLDTMTISIYVNTFARKIKIGFKNLYDVIKDDVRIVSSFSLKELSYIMYSLANVDRSALGDSVFHGECSSLHDGGDAREEGKRRFEEFVQGAGALWVDELDGMFDAAQGGSPKEIGSREEEDAAANEVPHPDGERSGNVRSSDGGSGDGGDDHPTTGRSKTIARKKNFLKFKRDRIEISSEFLNSLMEKVFNCASAILQRKKKYLQEAASDDSLYLSNANKRKKIEIIDLMKLVYSIFVFLNQRVLIGRVDGIRFDLAEQIIRLYSLIVKSFPSTLNYIYVIIDTYALISNVYTLDAFTRGIIKVGGRLVGGSMETTEPSRCGTSASTHILLPSSHPPLPLQEFVQICVKKVEEEKMLDLEKKKIILSIQNLKATN
ncbi:hypothetical protein PVIIG_04308 [Plasmodium vivax India VII]|uniref:Uncharacterized protein n=1 Tax=Plasmodium vivax India VII TaxID=1077284 RepID=A0A0J9V3J1_PLAVI|nr:hypothetical protein PVIIG_04308 [Plasmodium vivax India VII]